MISLPTVARSFEVYAWCVLCYKSSTIGGGGGGLDFLNTATANCCSGHQAIKILQSSVNGAWLCYVRKPLLRL